MLRDLPFKKFHFDCSKINAKLRKSDVLGERDSSEMCPVAIVESHENVTRSLLKAC